jgi:hypothetical protein
VASEPNPAVVWPVRPRPAPAGQRAFDLLLIGDCNPDVLVLGDDVTPAFGQQEKLVDTMALVVGGSASITAIAAARLGLRVALAAAIGDDAAGNFMLAELARAGVDTGGVTVRAQLPTGMTVALSRGEDRAILTAEGAIPTRPARPRQQLLPAGADPRAGPSGAAGGGARGRRVHVAGHQLGSVRRLGCQFLPRCARRDGPAAAQRGGGAADGRGRDAA